MVDIIKLLPPAATSFPSNTHHLRSKVFNQPIILPNYLTNTNNSFEINNLKNIQTKRWIGNCRLSPTSLIDVANSPYGIHRKIMYQQLSRHCSITVDPNRSKKSKQRKPSKETTKTSVTTTGNDGTTITPQPSFINDDNQSSRLFDTLSKHVTVKAEPLRPSNNFLNSATNTLTSWQRYWTSTHTQRRRKEASDPEPVLYRPKREQSLPGQTHFVVLRDSPHLPTALRQDDSQTSISTNTDIPTKVYNLTIKSDKQISSKKEDDTKKSAPQISTIEFVASSLIPACNEIDSPTLTSKISGMIPFKSIDKEDENNLADKSLSLLSSSLHFKTDCQLIEDIDPAQIEPRSITRTVYMPPLSVDKSKESKKSRSRKITQLIPTEKRETRPSSPLKGKRQIPIDKRLMNKLELSTIMAATSIYKYSERKWDAPYVGHRIDPPPPRSSPSLLVWHKDSDDDDDDDDDDTLYEKSEVFESNLPGKFSKK